MEFWYILTGIVGFILLLPYVRFIFKRLICAAKIKMICRKKGYQIHPTHLFWFLRSNLNRKCDLYIESENYLFSIKLFGVRRKVSILYVKENGEYFIRNIFGLLGFGGILSLPFDSRPRRMPAYDFRYGYRDEWEIKTPKAILLINPVPIEIRKQSRNSEEIVSSGDILYGMEIYSLSRMLEVLESTV